MIRRDFDWKPTYVRSPTAPCHTLSLGDFAPLRDLSDTALPMTQAHFSISGADLAPQLQATHPTACLLDTSTWVVRRHFKLSPANNELLSPASSPPPPMTTL